MNEVKAGCCRHCGQRLIFAPAAVLGETEKVWLHRSNMADGRGAVTCSIRPGDWPDDDSWPHAEPWKPSSPVEEFPPPTGTCARCGDEAVGLHRFPQSGMRDSPRDSWFAVPACGSHRTLDDVAEDRARVLDAIEEPNLPVAALLLTREPGGRSIVWGFRDGGWSPVNDHEPKPPITYAEVVLDYAPPTLLLPGPPPGARA